MTSKLLKALSTMVLLCSSQGINSFAQELKAFEGFESFAWGTPLEEVREKAEGTFDTIEAINADLWNAGDASEYLGFKMGPTPKKVRFLKRNAEIIDYYFIQDRLSMVIQTPNMYDMFRPSRMIRQLEELYTEDSWRSFANDVPLPHSFGTLSPETEVPVTVTYENETGRVRLSIKAWPPADLQQVYRVVYFSKERSRNHLKLLEEWKVVEAARIAAEQEAKRKKMAEKKRRTRIELKRKEAEAAGTRN